jgi:uncharacterized GH25 family protein
VKAVKRILASMFAVLALPALAHDFWIEPSTFKPAVGETFMASLRVGQDFLGDPVPRSSQQIERFVVRDAAGEHPVTGFENQDPAGYVRMDAAGAAIIGYRSKPYPLQLDARKFEDYLRQEGLDAILALRARRGESAKPDREVFSRCAKALIVTEGAKLSGYDKPLGFRLELIPETNPLAAQTRFRLLFEGKPLAGSLITALAQDGGMALRARTDAEGRVEFAFPKNGVWLVKCVHMIPAPAASGADWESLWASITFER